MSLRSRKRSVIEQPEERNVKSRTTEDFTLNDVEQVVPIINDIILGKQQDMIVRDTEDAESDQLSTHLDDREINEIVDNVYLEVNENLQQGTNTSDKIKKEIEELSVYIDNYSKTTYREETRMRILEAGFSAMQSQIEKEFKEIHNQEEISRIKLYLYNWAVTKTSQILRLGKKTVGFLTLLGLFSMYLPPGLLQRLPYILQPLIRLSQSIKPVVVGAQISGAAIITGYYILLKSGFDKEEINIFFNSMMNRTLSIYESMRSKVSSMHEYMRNIINSTTTLFEKIINNKLNEYAFSYEPSPLELPSTFSPIIIPSLSQDLYEKLKDVNNDLDKILNELNGQIDKTTEDDITQQILDLEKSPQQNYFTSSTVNLTQYNNSQEEGGEEESKSVIGGRRRHKRKTYRRRSTKRRRSSLNKKRRHTNRRRSRRSRRYHRR
jgi:hypothetical protein